MLSSLRLCPSYRSPSPPLHSPCHQHHQNCFVTSSPSHPGRLLEEQLHWPEVTAHLIMLGEPAAGGGGVRAERRGGGGCASSGRPASMAGCGACSMSLQYSSNSALAGGSSPRLPCQAAVPCPAAAPGAACTQSRLAAGSAAADRHQDVQLPLRSAHALPPPVSITPGHIEQLAAGFAGV